MLSLICPPLAEACFLMIEMVRRPDGILLGTFGFIRDKRKESILDILA